MSCRLEPPESLDVVLVGAAADVFVRRGVVVVEVFDDGSMGED